MKVEIIVDKKLSENKACLYVKEETQDIKKLYENILNDYKKIEAYIENEKILLNLNDIESIFSETGKVYVKTSKEKFILRKRLYDIENILPNYFIRISNSEIVNFNNVEKINTKILGTLEIRFKSGNVAYSSRRYIKKIKDELKKEVL